MTLESTNYATLTRLIEQWSDALGFDQVGITDTDLGVHKAYLDQWLANGHHGSMGWMNNNVEKRKYPEQLVPEALRIISVRMNYLPENTEQIKRLKEGHKAYISRYALGRDYHKLIRKRLAKLADQIQEWALSNEDTLALSQRPFVDSAPVLEKALAEKAGLGWIGKHTLVLNQAAGSWFFLGELITNLPLPLTHQTVKNQCGDCTACLKVCPTDAFVAPYQLDASRCISYLTIENKGAIPLEYREPMGNRVFGCDDCQIICPWNKFSPTTQESDFRPRHNLHDAELVDLFLWTEAAFLRHTEGSPIRRIGYEGWQRNLSVGLGNAPSDPNIIQALKDKRAEATPMVKEHIDWAIQKQTQPSRRIRKIKRKDQSS